MRNNQEMMNFCNKYRITVTETQHYAEVVHDMSDYYNDQYHLSIQREPVIELKMNLSDFQRMVEMDDITAYVAREFEPYVNNIAEIVYKDRRRVSKLIETNPVVKEAWEQFQTVLKLVA